MSAPITNPLGFLLPDPGNGDDLVLLSRTALARMVRRVNALTKLKIQRGAADSFVVSDANSILTIARAVAGEAGVGSSVAIYKITSISGIASDYVAGKLVTFDNANAETLAASAVDIALPWQLRSGRAGTAFPAYAVNDYIVVASSDTGVGVVVSGAQLTLVDMGIGRQMEGFYRGAWSSAVEYGFGDFVHTLAGSDLVTLLWVATQTHTNHTPSASSTTYWRLVGVYGDFRRFTVDASPTQNDYWVCDEINGDASNVNIYKPTKLRGSVASESIAGDTVTYSGYTTDKMERTATNSSNSEKQVIIPYVLTGDVLHAQYDVREDKWNDLNVNARAWARKFDQS